MYAKWMHYTAQGKYNHCFMITLNGVYSIKILNYCIIHLKKIFKNLELEFIFRKRNPKTINHR